MYNNGYTLIEMTLYVAFTAAGLLLGGMFTLQVLSDKAQLMAMNDIAQNASFAMEHIASDIRAADSVNAPEIASSGDTLIIHDPKQNETLTFSNDAGVLMRTGSSSIALTANDVTLTDLEFDNVSYPGAPNALRISFTLTRLNPGHSNDIYHETFRTTVVSRFFP